jgi:hypothetical protein
MNFLYLLMKISHGKVCFAYTHNICLHLRSATTYNLCPVQTPLPLIGTDGEVTLDKAVGLDSSGRAI